MRNQMDNNADKVFKAVGNFHGEIKGFRGRPSDITIVMVPQVTMGFEDASGRYESHNVDGLMPRVRQQIAQRILEAKCRTGCHPLPEGMTEEEHKQKCFYQTLIPMDQWL